MNVYIVCTLKGPTSDCCHKYVALQLSPGVVPASSQDLSICPLHSPFQNTHQSFAYVETARSPQAWTGYYFQWDHADSHREGAKTEAARKTAS